MRQALKYAEKELRIDRLLLREELRTKGGQIFLDRYGELISLSASGQMAMRRLFLQHLRRVEWDSRKFPARLYPFIVSDSSTSEMSIAIDPEIAFGRPILLSKGISTEVIADRIDAGERVDGIAEDYGLSVQEIERAIMYERAA